MRDVSDVADERRCLLDDAVNIASSKLAEFENASVRLAKWQTDSEVGRAELLQHIATSAYQLKSLIDDKQQRLNDDVEQMFTQRLQVTKNVRTAIDDQLPELKNLLARFIFILFFCAAVMLARPQPSRPRPRT